MEPIEYLKAIRRRWLIVVAAVAIVVPLAWLTTSVAPAGAVVKSYSATTYLLSLGNLEGGSGVANLPTLAKLVSLPQVAERVAVDIGYTGDPSVLSAQVNANADPTTGFLTIAASSTNAHVAKITADSFAKELLAFVNERAQATQQQELGAVQTQLKTIQADIDRLDRQVQTSSGTQQELLKAQRNAKLTTYTQLSAEAQQLATTASPGAGLVIIQPATPVLVPNTGGFQAPRSRKARILLAALVALLAGIALALVVERFDSRIRTKETAERRYHLPVLAEIPMVGRWRRPKRLMPSIDQPHSTQADAFRMLGAGLAGATAASNGSGATRSKGADVGPNGNGRRKPPRTLLVTSAGPSEGKSTVVANLAATYASLGKKVIVLSCDFRHPRVHELLGTTNQNGLAEALATANGSPVLGLHLRDTKVHEVRLVPSGERPDRPGMLLSSTTMIRALQEAREQSDVVILDTPPILASADATQLLGEVDRVLIVARAGKTTGELAERTSELLIRLGAPIAGVALNCAKEAPMPRGYYRYTAGFFGVKRA